jgi:hypothetical protein
MLVWMCVFFSAKITIKNNSINKKEEKNMQKNREKKHKNKQEKDILVTNHFLS